MTIWNVLVLASVLAVASSSAAAGNHNDLSEHDLSYPVAHRDHTVDTYFGTKVQAPYQWMENLDNRALHKWVKAENALTEKYLSGLPLRGWIKQRLIKLRSNPTESTPIQLANGMLFFSRNSGLQNQSVVYMKQSASSERQPVFDPNKLSPDGKTALAAYEPSPQGQYLVYALSKGGSDWETVHVLNVKTGEKLPDMLQWIKFSPFSWTRDGKGFFYSRYPEPEQGRKINQKIINQKLYYHRLGTPQSEDRLVFSLAGHPEWIVTGYLDDRGRYLFVSVADGTSRKNKLYYADLGDPANPNIQAKIKPLFTKSDARYTPIGIVGDTLYLQTTYGAPRGEIVATKLGNPNPATWRVVVPEAEGVLQTPPWNTTGPMVGGKIVVNYLFNATSQLKLFSTSGKLLHTFKLPPLSSLSYTGVSAHSYSDVIYYSVSSFLQPTTVYSYNVETKKANIYFKPKIGFDASKYQTKQIFYHSKDGTRVPMFIVAKKGIKLDGSHPTVLYAYGGFGVIVSPSFNPMIPVWLRLGGIYAVANIRGGGFYGKPWHQAGMLDNKKDVFDDFAWAAKYLIHQGYTSVEHLGIQGYSNGGLLTAASITERPELFGAAYIGHGVLDMLRYQKFSGGGLWVNEFGSSDNKKAFQWLIKYSPMQNIHTGTCYPPTLITTSWSDDRVVPSHEFKFTAKIQRAQGCANPILLRTTSDTAHNYMPTDKEIAQTADVWAFEGYNLGMRVDASDGAGESVSVSH